MFTSEGCRRRFIPKMNSPLLLLIRSARLISQGHGLPSASYRLARRTGTPSAPSTPKEIPSEEAEKSQPPHSKEPSQRRNIRKVIIDLRLSGDFYRIPLLLPIIWFRSNSASTSSPSPRMRRARRMWPSSTRMFSALPWKDMVY
jgi:hypothetical protein